MAPSPRALISTPHAKRKTFESPSAQRKSRCRAGSARLHRRPQSCGRHSTLRPNDRSKCLRRWRAAATATLKRAVMKISSCVYRGSSPIPRCRVVAWVTRSCRSIACSRSNRTRRLCIGSFESWRSRIRPAPKRISPSHWPASTSQAMTQRSHPPHSRKWTGRSSFVPIGSAPRCSRQS